MCTGNILVVLAYYAQRARNYPTMRELGRHRGQDTSRLSHRGLVTTDVWFYQPSVMQSAVTAAATPPFLDPCRAVV